MQPERLRELLRQEPFQPFRLHLRDGRVFDVPHPRLMLVFRTYAILGIPAPDETLPIYDYTVDIPLDDIDRAEKTIAADSLRPK
jgi:hypothetical protein